MAERRILPLLAACLAGCSPEAPVEPPSSTPPSPSTPPPASGEPRSARFEASVEGARSTGESAPAALVTLRFENGTTEAVTVKGYVLDWPGGRFEAHPSSLHVAANSEVERTARIDSRHGDVGALLARPDEATLTVTLDPPDSSTEKPAG